MLAQVVEEAANRFGDTAAFAAPDGTVTSYAELHARACAVAAGLSAQGVGEGDVVALRTASDLGYVLAYLCLLYTSPSPRDRQKSRMPSSA